MNGNKYWKNLNDSTKNDKSATTTKYYYSCYLYMYINIYSMPLRTVTL
jgi:hypothetical protein